MTADEEARAKVEHTIEVIDIGLGQALASAFTILVSQRAIGAGEAVTDERLLRAISAHIQARNIVVAALREGRIPELI